MIPFDEYGYCGGSVCDETWRAGDACVMNDVEFYEGDCEVRTDALGSAAAPSSSSFEVRPVESGGIPNASGDESATPPVSSSTPSVAAPPTTIATDSSKIAQYIDIEPSAMATTKRSFPTVKNDLTFSLENGDERVSFVRFDLPPVPEGRAVENAVLRVYLVDSENESATVSVLALPRSGDRWSTRSVSYDEPLDATKSSSWDRSTPCRWTWASRRRCTWWT